MVYKIPQRQLTVVEVVDFKKIGDVVKIGSEGDFNKRKSKMDKAKSQVYYIVTYYSLSKGIVIRRTGTWGPLIGNFSRIIIFDHNFRQCLYPNKTCSSLNKRPKQSSLYDIIIANPFQSIIQSYTQTNDYQLITDCKPQRTNSAYSVYIWHQNSVICNQRIKLILFAPLEPIQNDILMLPF